VIAAAKPNLSNTEFQELEDIVTKYRDIFAMDSNDYRLTDKVYHHMDMEEARPFHQPPRRLQLVKQADMGEMLEDMQ
jgi:hypothetical protein